MLLQEQNPIENLEKSLLSLIINSGDENYVLYASEKLDSKDFSNPFAQTIFLQICQMVLQKNLKIDKSLLFGKVKGAKNQAIFEDIIKTDYNSDNLKYYIDEIKNSSGIRNVKKAIAEASIKIQEYPDIKAADLASFIEDKLLETVTSNRFDFTQPKDSAQDLLKKVLEGKREIEFSTTFRDLDELIGGLPNDYIIVGGRPGNGKTELAIHMMVQNAIVGKRSAFFSLEMDEDMIIKRMMANFFEVPFNEINECKLTPLSKKIIEKNFHKFEELPVHYDTTPGLSAQAIFAKAKRLKIKYPDLKAVFIDYAQLISSSDIDSQEQGLTKISRTILNMRKALKIPVVLLSQLSRNSENRENKRPMLSDLRGSGSFEQDGAVIMFMFNEHVYDENVDPKKTEIIVSKNRHGQLGTVIVENQKDIQKFTEKI